MIGQTKNTSAMATEADQEETQEPTAGGNQYQHGAGEEELRSSPAAEITGDGVIEAEEGEDDGEGARPQVLQPSLPSGRVKRIVKLDREISRVNSEALHLITLSVDLFLGFLAGRAGMVALRSKKKIVRIDHLRAAAGDHHPTGDFLLDSLSQLQARVLPLPEARRKPSADKPLPPGARRIDEFFHKPSTTAIE